eukprot:1887804-Pyramimonas_sp.AAC.1
MSGTQGHPSNFGLPLKYGRDPKGCDPVTVQSSRVTVPSVLRDEGRPPRCKQGLGKHPDIC